jgi:hypothetical protein
MNADTTQIAADENLKMARRSEQWHETLALLSAAIRVVSACICASALIPAA